MADNNVQENISTMEQQLEIALTSSRINELRDFLKHELLQEALDRRLTEPPGLK